MPAIKRRDGGLALTSEGRDPNFSAMSIRATSAISRQSTAMGMCMDMCIARVRVEGHGG